MKRIERIRRQFYGKAVIKSIQDILINWSQVCMAKQFGSLGMVLFWHDLWFENCILAIRFPALSKRCLTKNQCCKKRFNDRLNSYLIINSGQTITNTFNRGLFADEND